MCVCVFFFCFRQACAIESAARWNTNRSVFVLSVSPVGLSKKIFSPIMTALQFYPNIHFRNVNLQTYMAGTPMEQFFKSKRIFESKFLVSHTSDMMRYATLYKFGGIYLDLDVVVQKNLDHLPPNFSCNEDAKMISVGAMGFQHDNIGHQLTTLCVR